MQWGMKSSAWKIFDKLNWPKINFHVVKPTNIEFGEYTSNVALSASKTLSTKPQEIAQKIIDNFDNKKFNIKGGIVCQEKKN